MEKRRIAASELVLTPDFEIYHLHLKPEQIADTIFLVGDPGRVKAISSLFDSIEFKVENREFVTHTGIYNNKRISVLSTGIGTDNIDIVINELDALANIDLETRTVKSEHKKLNFIRIGTSGALHENITPGSVIVSEVSGGLDNLLHYYNGLEKINDKELADAFNKHMHWNKKNSLPYFIHASSKLIEKISRPEYFRGITLSAPGFYAPQGRSLRLQITDPDYVDKISDFRHKDLRINNFEMEGSALCGLSRLLGHEAVTICIALANRISGEVTSDYQSYIIELVKDVLNRISTND